MGALIPIAAFTMILPLFILGLVALRILLRSHLEPGALRHLLPILITGSLFPVTIVTYCGETFTAVTMGVGIIARLLRVIAGQTHALLAC